MRQPESFATRPHARSAMGVLVTGGHEGIGASVTAALLAREAQSDGARVLIVGPAPRAQRIAAMFGVETPAHDAPPVRVDRGIHVCSHLPRAVDADVILSVPPARVQLLLDAMDALSAQTDPTHALVLAHRGAPSLAAAYAVLKLIVGHRPQCTLSLAACGDADVSALHAAAERWLGHPILTAPSIPLDPTLPVALGAGIPLAEAVADTALFTAAGALWSALASAALTGALA